MRRAIAYTREMPPTESREVIPRESQEERIRQFAAMNGIEIVAWFADGTEERSILNRAGIQALLACSQPYELVICERAWVLSRSMADLNTFLKELGLRGLEFTCVTLLWDYVSQQCRRRSKSLPVLPRVIQTFDKAGRAVRYHVRKPVRLNFVHLVHPENNSRYSAVESHR